MVTIDSRVPALRAALNGLPARLIPSPASRPRPRHSAADLRPRYATAGRGPRHSAAQVRHAGPLPDGVPADGRYEDVDVAIVMESTYPYLKGGVSAVVHDIIVGNPDLTFGIIHITWDSDSPHTDLYGMPGNVRWVRPVYLSMQEHPEFMAARPEDLHMSAGERKALALRLVRALHSLGNGDTAPMWSLIDDGMAASTRRFPLWALLGTSEFLSAYRESLPTLGMSVTDLFWCLREFFSLAYAVLHETMPRARVYHAHTTGYACLLAANAAREHGTSFLLTEHNLYVRDTVNTLLGRRMDKPVKKDHYRTFDVPGRDRMWMAWWIELGRLCYPPAYAITYLYPDAVTEALDLGTDGAKARLIPNGIVTQEFDEVYRSRLRKNQRLRKEGTHAHMWRLVYIARVVPIKGLLDLLDAIRILKDRGANIHLDVCGPTEHMPEYYERCVARIAELGLEEDVTIRGTVQVREHLGEWDLFLLPSYNEGLPIVSLETMAAGIPTVSTDVGAVRSVVQDGIVDSQGHEWGPSGFVIVPGKPRLMADRVQEFIDDVDLYERMSLAARGRAEAAYNLVAVNSAYRDLYFEGGVPDRRGRAYALAEEARVSWPAVRPGA
ncbi:GT4 family glycosyltransferase PelF [Actinomyces sp.]|uniref:GT4 family glycosyltransferase PelF n=1 Tax=Actinomyces sp. TaxID=29317 RepID=UPI0026DA9D30|nr:GT4 family glycosyltransferase PelF [Actinomyces sp.]MDO4901538.1 GT4 family glycosyltransferase PelF [Actinomyces sp.]